MSSSKFLLGSHQAKGKQLQDWLEGRNGNTLKVRPSSVKYTDIPNREKISNKLSQVSDMIRDAAKPVDLLKVDGNHYSLTFRPTTRPTENYWEGLVTPGGIFITDCTRVTGPFVSEISLAAYEKHFPITTEKSLNHIFMMYCTNEDTRTFIQEKVCQSWPPREQLVFTPGSDEYQGILGTALGKVAASMVLGKYKPGTMRISAITVWDTEDLPSLRFDLKEAEKSHPTGSKRRSRNEQRLLSNEVNTSK